MNPLLMSFPDGLPDGPHFTAAETQFATLPGFIEYAAALPRSPVALLRRLATVRKFPI